MTDDLLQRLETFYDAVSRAEARTEQVGPRRATACIAQAAAART